MDTTTPVGKLVTTLKQQLKAKRLTYNDVACRMEVSEATVKRYFSGKGITVDVLQKLAKIVDLDFFSLASLAQEEDSVRSGVNDAQLSALQQRGPLSSIFYLLATGWTPSQIARELDIGERLDGILDDLEELKLIRRLPRKGVRVLVQPDTREKDYGQMRQLAIDSAHRFLLQLNLHDPKCEWKFYHARLTKASALKLKELIARFESDIRALSRQDIAQSPEHTEWYKLFVGARPTDRKSLLSMF